MRIVACGALGDALLTTPAFRALKEQDPSRRVVVYCTSRGQYELYLHNPYVDRLVRPGPMNRYERWILTSMRRTKLWHDGYGALMPSMFCSIPATEIIGNLLGVRLRDNQLQVFLTPEEEEEGRRLLAPCEMPVAIHLTSRFSANQHWPIEKWRELVRRNPRYTFVQLGLSDEAPVAGAFDLRGQLSVRTALAVLKHSRSFVGVVSFFSHASNAVGTRGVVLFGPSTTVVWGHQNNINLELGLPCAPCVDLLQNMRCPYGAPCMSDISVDRVEHALTIQLAVTS